MIPKIHSLIAVCFAAIATVAPLSAESGPVESRPESTTADWYLDEECRMVFFTVLEGLYRDGVPTEVVNLVIGRVERNDVEKRFVFRCKLCHACYEAFALYQRRPAFSGTEGVDTIGSKPIPPAVIHGLRDDASDLEFGMAFSTIIQPWIKAKLLAMELTDQELAESMKKFSKLAQEGNALIDTYKSCQACDAIHAVSEIMAQPSVNP